MMEKEPLRKPGRSEIKRLAGGRERFRKWMTPWLFLAVPLTVYLVMLAYPLVSSLILSFTRWSGMGSGPSFVGITNYSYLMLRGNLLIAIKNNLLWLVLFVPVPTVIGFVLAFLLREDTKLNVSLRFMFYLPMIVSNAIVAIIWMTVYEPSHGILTETLKLLRFTAPTRSFLTRPDTAIVAISIAGIWHWIGFSLIIYLAAIQDIPQDLLEAAELDGTTEFQKVRYIIIPLVRHATIVVITLGTILSMKVFDLVYLMSGGYYKNDVMGTLIWRMAFEQYRVGRASATAGTQFLIIAAMVIPYIWWQRKSGEIEI